MSSPLLIFNWKSNPPDLAGARTLASAAERALKKRRTLRVVIAPPYPFLTDVGQRIQKAFLGAQDSFWEGGPHTGDVSPNQLKAVGVRYCILGHSERRIQWGETDENIGKKIVAVLERGMRPVLCVGERERTGRDIPAVVGDEVRAALRGIPARFASKIVVVYEPVWAISSMPAARPDDPESAFRAKMYIRRVLGDIFGRKAAERIFILYGGSVTPSNIRGFLNEGSMDGALIGSAGLDVKKVAAIIEIAASR